MDLTSIGPILWIVVDGLGLVMALVALICWPRLRPAAALVAVSLLMALGLHGAWPLLLAYWHEQLALGLYSNEEHRAAVENWSLASGIIGALAKGLLIAAVFAFRSGDVSVTARSTPGTPIPGTVMPALSKGARIGGILVSLALSICCAGGAVLVAHQRGEELAPLLLLAAALLFAILASVLVAMTLHALWRTIQPPPRGRGRDGLARSTAGRAVGLLFVPLWNLYWGFQAVPGLATDINKTLDALAIDGARVPRGLGIAWCVIAILSFVPVVGAFLGLAGLLILPLFLGAAIDAANRIRTAAADDR